MGIRLELICEKCNKKYWVGLLEFQDTAPIKCECGGYFKKTGLEEIGEAEEQAYLEENFDLKDL